MDFILRHINLIAIVYLVGLTLTSMLYVPYKVARYKLQGIGLALSVVGCFLWPVTFPLFLLGYLIFLPITRVFKFMVKSFTLDEDKVKPEDERRTVPMKLNPKFMNAVRER